MERVMIIGCGGAGKSTLARKLGEKTGLPVVHLDQIWWSPGNWEHLSREESDVRLERADTVIYLDFSRWLCLRGWIGRVIRNWGHAREDMAPGCNERFDPEMAKWIWNFNKQNRQRYLDKLKDWNGEVHILHNRRQVCLFLWKLK